LDICGAVLDIQHEAKVVFLGGGTEKGVNAVESFTRLVSLVLVSKQPI